MIAWTIFSDSDEIEEIEVDHFDLITKSNSLDFDKGVNLCLLREKLGDSLPPCVKLARESR